MKTIIIIGPQGCGKSTLGKHLLPKPTYLNDLSADADMSLAQAMHFLFEDRRASGEHSILCDEADVFFSLLGKKEKDAFRRYWALARHRGLKTSVWIARRYVQIPIFIRSSATEIYISCRTRGRADLAMLEKEGCDVIRGAVDGGEYHFYQALV